jgi:hypothetical protein
MVRICALCVVLLFPFLVNSQIYTKGIGTNTGYPNTKVIAGDLNNDSVPDLLILNQASLDALRMNTKGEFDDIMFHRTEMDARTTDIATADFNHDHRLDVVITTEDSAIGGNGVILFGTGQADFVRQPTFDAGSNPFRVGVGDFNGDGTPDIVTAWLQVNDANDPSAKQTNKIQISYVNAQGRVSSTKILSGLGHQDGSLEKDRRLVKLAVGDFNGDRLPDIVFIERGGDVGGIPTGDIYVVMNQGGGNFKTIFVSEQHEPADIGVSDVDGDGFDDLIFTVDRCGFDLSCFQPTLGIAYYHSSGNGQFQAAGGTSFPADGYRGILHEPHVGDLNADGLKEITVGATIPDSFTGGGALLAWYPGPDGRFDSGTQVKTFPAVGADVELTSAYLLDVTQDGLLDFTAAASGLTVMQNTLPVVGCHAPAQHRSLRLCLPSGETITSPVQVRATPKAPFPIEAMKIYVDGVVKYSTKDNLLSTRLGLPPGNHRMTVKAWDRLGPYSQMVNFTVSEACVLPGTDRTVKICTPTAEGISGSPVQIKATISDASPLKSAQIYLDNVLTSRTGSTHLVDTALPMSSGRHRITVKAWDAAGQFSQTLIVNVP